MISPVDRGAWLGLPLLLAGLLAAGCAVGSGTARKSADDPEVLYEASFHAISEKNFPLAELRLARALELRPADPRFLELLAGVRVVQGDWPGALAAADETLAANPKSTDARNSRGIALLELGKPVEAEAQFRAVLSDPRFPQTVRPRYNLALALLRQGRNREALAEFYQVQRADPALPGIWARIGAIRENLEDWNAAVANYLEAVKRDPTDLRCMIRLGICFARLAKESEEQGDAAAAARSTALSDRYFARVLELSPASSEAVEARILLGRHGSESSGPEQEP